MFERNQRSGVMLSGDSRTGTASITGQVRTEDILGRICSLSLHTQDVHLRRGSCRRGFATFRVCHYLISKECGHCH